MGIVEPFFLNKLNMSTYLMPDHTHIMKIFWKFCLWTFQLSSIGVFVETTKSSGNISNWHQILSDIPNLPLSWFGHTTGLWPGCTPTGTSTPQRMMGGHQTLDF